MKPYNEAYFLHIIWKSKNTRKNELTEVGIFFGNMMSWMEDWWHCCQYYNIYLSAIILLLWQPTKGIFIPCHYVLLLL
jgi:hypothetical protein